MKETLGANFALSEDTFAEFEFAKDSKGDPTSTPNFDMARYVSPLVAVELICERL